LSYVRTFTEQEQIGLQVVETTIDSTGTWIHHPGTGLIERTLVEQKVDAQEVGGQLIRVTTTSEHTHRLLTRLPDFMTPDADG
ncbi:MAG: hypothetical protein ACOCXJ_04890, partial [Planctomycetota bacterium]